MRIPTNEEIERELLVLKGLIKPKTQERVLVNRIIRMYRCPVRRVSFKEVFGKE